MSEAIGAVGAPLCRCLPQHVGSERIHKAAANGSDFTMKEFKKKKKENFYSKSKRYPMIVANFPFSINKELNVDMVGQIKLAVKFV